MSTMTCCHCGMQLREMEPEGTDSRRVFYVCDLCGVAYTLFSMFDASSDEHLVELPVWEATDGRCDYSYH